jgi:hypothetical protein
MEKRLWSAQQNKALTEQEHATEERGLCLRRFRTFALASTISESQIEQAQIVRHWII